MNKIGEYIIPVVIFLIIVFGFIRKVPVFDSFILGAKDGFQSTVSILPSLVGLVMAVSMLKASGALDIFISFISPVAQFLSIPPQVTPLMLLRPISGSGSLALIDSIFSTCGVDSFAGRVAAVIMGSTETTFYTITVYFGAINIKNSRHAIPSALSADMASFIISALAVRLLF